ncbi:DUF323 domain-containing protein [Laetiporus sulphureus 93-53]|uniref:DUF323 domain-containing protein n=1 Tax=Laetiporus sulphureus 93-53 TaxID=1314785 RepID=A0A165HI68_9APHY|nr:DUF323 domain-containing protein [Laetiporus sulphureus 93-53]KZT11762.1 DUF323 domain-containing protein [Laetiporus sulphureus 93-53]
MASAPSVPPVNIINVRAAKNATNGEGSIRDQIIAGLSRPAGQKSLSTMLLYDERGLRLYDDITTKAPEYYLFPAEEQIFKQHADDIAAAMHARDGGKLKTEEAIVELGAGSLRKTSHILRALAELVPPTVESPITYYALDLQESELKRTLEELNRSEIGAMINGKVTTQGLCATYDDGLNFIQEGGLEDRGDVDRLSIMLIGAHKPSRDTSPSATSDLSGRDSVEADSTPPSTPGARQPVHLLFLGSSLGNFTRGEDAAFLRSLPLRPDSGDTLLLGLDHDNDPSEIELAYNDPKGITREFIMNGLRCTGRALGDESLFDESKWEYVGKYNADERRHEAYYKSIYAQSTVDPATSARYAYEKDELVRIEVSYKFSERDAYTLFTRANLRPIHRWLDSSSRYSLWLLERPPFMFPLLSPSIGAPEKAALVPASKSSQTPFGMPTLDDWQNMWDAWDFITQRMIPPSMMFQKPIDLRHICLFYLGHIPTFLSIHLSRLLQEPDTEPVKFKYIFERGIDPNVDDPTQCHPHSEVPQRDEEWPSLPSILSYQYSVRERVRKLYRDIEAGTVKLTRKIARVLFMTLEHEAFHAETLLYMLLQRAGTGTIPPSGFSPPMWSILAESWDHILPPKSSTVTLGPATITLGHDDDEAEDSSTEVAGHAFGWDNERPKRNVQVGKFKIEWRPVTNGEFFDFYSAKGRGLVSLPASWIEIDGEIFVRTLYGPISMKIARDWPIVTSYDNLSTYARVKGGRIPTEPELRLFLDMFECGYEGGANIGFRNWHPVPATMGGEKSGGKGHNGGVWEWTSTVFEKHDGFVPSPLYPGYSLDFFDGCHQVVIGGSYATIPRLAERRTVRNYYQHNYPYAWVGARIAYDV